LEDEGGLKDLLPNVRCEGLVGIGDIPLLTEEGDATSRKYCEATLDGADGVVDLE